MFQPQYIIIFYEIDVFRVISMIFEIQTFEFFMSLYDKRTGFSNMLRRCAAAAADHIDSEFG